MRFGELLKLSKPDLVVSRRYDAWAIKNSNPTYSEEALAFGHEALALQATPRDRRGTFSASSLGKCKRRQQFTFIGMPEDPFTAKTSNILINGTFMHIRWQMAGITEGFFKKVEVPISENPWRLSGTIDAIAHDDTVVEIKSANNYAFRNAMQFGSLFGHEEQLATYMLLTDSEKGALLYENKDTQEYCEIVKRREELPTGKIEHDAEWLWDMTDKKKLFEPLDAVFDNKQPCSTCPFKSQCPEMRTWSQAVETAKEVQR